MNVDKQEEPYQYNNNALNTRIEEITQEYLPNEWDINWDGADNWDAHFDWNNWNNLPPLPKADKNQDKTPTTHHP